MLTYNRNELELCRIYQLDSEAHIAEAALAEAGIESVLDNEIFSRIYPIGFNTLGGIRLMVRHRDMERALGILDSLNFSGE